ncbi:MAG: hypothetical protein KatS3mg068_2372 [Candidatus Sericytochromatia bacterium]|nr:MAG: hypothetical protein KatS3mg068_2372 [Candidatus Sericytochromatia bacterium]
MYFISDITFILLPNTVNELKQMRINLKDGLQKDEAQKILSELKSEKSNKNEINNFLEHFNNLEEMKGKQAIKV